VALPRGKEARSFYRAAQERLTDARVLLDADRTTGATYLAGYAVECILKALILDLLPPKRRPAMIESFRGARAHDLEWLRARYLEHSGPLLPDPILRRLALMNRWDTDRRYHTGTIARDLAEDFVSASSNIVEWAEGRM
jgi:HEPN domain-containing protein